MELRGISKRKIGRLSHGLWIQVYQRQNNPCRLTKGLSPLCGECLRDGTLVSRLTKWDGTSWNFVAQNWPFVSRVVDTSLSKTTIFDRKSKSLMLCVFQRWHILRPRLYGEMLPRVDEWVTRLPELPRANQLFLHLLAINNPIKYNYIQKI